MTFPKNDDFPQDSVFIYACRGQDNSIWTAGAEEEERPLYLLCCRCCWWWCSAAEKDVVILSHYHWEVPSNPKAWYFVEKGSPNDPKYSIIKNFVGLYCAPSQWEVMIYKGKKFLFRFRRIEQLPCRGYCSQTTSQGVVFNPLNKGN